MDTFKLQATESAPKDYPMEIISGSLIYPQGGSLYVPNKKTIHQGWGVSVSSHVVGAELKPLPKALSITFFSYTENQFYRGEFELPYDKILALFRVGYYSPNEDDHITYHRIMVGVAPGGAVSVWLRGFNRITEVFFGQAEKFEGKWSSINNNSDFTREEFVRLEIEESLKSPEALEALNKNGVPIGLWDSYRTRYHWQPVLTGMSVRDDRIDEIQYFNGEYDYLNYPLDDAVTALTRPVPRLIYFIWARTPVKGLSFQLSFDETEITDAFKRLGSQNQPLKLEFLMEQRDGKPMFFVVLHNEKESYTLKNTQVKTYGVDDLEVEPAN